MRGCVFKWLVVFPANSLTGRQEVDSQKCEFAFVALAGIFDSIDMEWNGSSHDGKNNRAVL